MTCFCAQISGVQTQGIHGLTCVSNGSPSAAVLLDASNNSIEDVSIDGFIDGIVVGENANAQSNVLFNIQYPGAVGLLNLIHICGNNNTYDTCPTIHTVTDLAIMGATVPPYNCQPGQVCLAPDATIKDDVSGTALLAQLDDHVGMYVLGKSSNGGGTHATRRAPAYQRGRSGQAFPRGHVLRAVCIQTSTEPPRRYTPAWSRRVHGWA